MCSEATVQQVRRNVECVVAVRPRRANDPPDHYLTLLDFEFADSFNGVPFLRGQSPDTPPLAVCMQTGAGQRVPDIDADSLQFFGHPWAGASGDRLQSPTGQRIAASAATSP